MLLKEMLKDEREEGRAEGRIEGEQLTLEKMNRLVLLLSDKNRLEDMLKAANDPDYQERLFKEFNL